MAEKKQGNYEDIIHLPHHVSSVDPQMPLLSRAAQFAPFAALAGHEAALEETARLTASRVELDEQEQSILDGKLRWIRHHLDQSPAVEVMFFETDDFKTGGRYERIAGCVKNIDLYRRVMQMTDGNGIPLDEIRHITLLQPMEDEMECIGQMRDFDEFSEV